MNTKRIFEVLTSLFKKRKRRTLYLGGVLVALFIVIRAVSNEYLVVEPVIGGGFSEAMVGYPRFVNPVLAQSPTDRDLVNLVFSGLLKKNAVGEYVPDMASSFEITEAGKEYRITLDESATFHDGSVLTIDDVLFTYELIQDPLMKSPLYTRLLQTSVTSPEEGVLVFKSNSNQTDFEDNLTVGIMQKNQWQDISTEEFAFAEQNVSPIGSGPFEITNITRDAKQRISAFTLSAYRENTHIPFINTVTARFYETQLDALNAFEDGRVDNFGNISAQELLSLDRSLEDKLIQSHPLSRVFSLFFNQEQNKIFENDTVRNAIHNSINKQQIIERVFFARAEVADGPLSSSHPYYTEAENTQLSTEDIESALKKDGWERNANGVMIRKTDTTSEILSFSLKVPEVTELIKSAEFIRDDLQKVGIEARLEVVPERDFTNSVIRKRDFETILFGQIVEEPAQLYGFWHSSGVDDPGVNIAGYENTTLDAILERLVANESNEEKTKQDYVNLQKEIRDDLPVVFLFTPYFIYASDKKIQDNALQSISFASDRFNHITDWYISTQSLLPWFTE